MNAYKHLVETCTLIMADISDNEQHDISATNVNITETNDVTLTELNREEVLRQIPLIIYLVLISGIGILGNVLVWFVYKTKYGSSNCRTFLLFLSSIDLLSCSLGVPFEILFVMRQYNFRNAAACRISVLLNTWPTLTAGFVLLAIAVDRYRKICRPFGWQISMRYSVILCVLCVVLGASFSWLSPLIYGIEKSSHHIYKNITISQCTVTEKMKNETLFPLMNNISFAVLFLGALGAMSVLYCFIGAGVRAHVKRRDKMRLSLPKSSFNADTSDASELTIKSGVVALGRMKESKHRKDETKESLFCTESSESRSNEQSSSVLDNEPCLPERHYINPSNTDNSRPISNRKSVLDRMLSLGRYSINVLSRTSSSATSYSGNTIRRNSRDRKSHSEHDRAKKITFVMFLISLAFVLSYLPLLCILLIRSINTKFVGNLSDHGRAAYNFFLRSYYLNCMINPIIYGLWDAKFRKTCRRLFCRR